MAEDKATSQHLPKGAHAPNQATPTQRLWPNSCICQGGRQDTTSGKHKAARLRAAARWHFVCATRDLVERLCGNASPRGQGPMNVYHTVGHMGTVPHVLFETPGCAI